MENIKLPDFFNNVNIESIKSMTNKTEHCHSSIIDSYQFIEDGQHFWAKIHDGSLKVFIKLRREYFIAGNWEGSFNSNEFEFIQIIKEPKK